MAAAAACAGPGAAVAHAAPSKAKVTPGKTYSSVYSGSGRKIG